METAGQIKQINLDDSGIYDLNAKYIQDSEGHPRDWADILAAISHSNLRIETVTTLPRASADTMGAIYLVKKGKSEGNVFNEYITVLSGSTYKWEQIGSTETDLINYVKKNETYINGATAAGAHTHAFTCTTEVATKVVDGILFIDAQHSVLTGITGSAGLHAHNVLLK